ncbi:hypothetical protein L3N51_01415 [Metallosphaera sp. J1]|nr:hypothetical protein [Metallosphaera javensis (ex Hofmann et al. 2022)]
MDEKDSNHELAIKLDENIEDDNKVVSGLVLLELASVYTRAGFDKPIELAFYFYR